jgi:hypothetical protein
MAWHPNDDHDSIDAVDEASVGLIASKSEYATQHPTKQRFSYISKSSLGVVLILSNMVWVGVCLILWRELHQPPNPSQNSLGGFETDFGTFALKSD